MVHFWDAAPPPKKTHKMKVAESAKKFGIGLLYSPQN